MSRRLWLVGLLATFACNDPKDPQTWIKKLRDPQHATEAVRQLQDIGDPVAVKPLCDLFKDFQSPNILKAVISFKHRSSIPTLIEALDFTEDKYHNATLAAKALADFKATEAVGPLTKILERQLPIRSRANLAKLAAIGALAEIGDTSAVPALIATLERRPEQQDFLLNKKSAEALGMLGDPRAVPALIKGLFMSSTLQGDAFPFASVALVRLGAPAVQPLIDAMQRKNKDLEAMAKELAFKEGIIEQKAAIVLGDMALPEAVPALLEQLKGFDLKETKAAGVIEALGKIADKTPVPQLVKILTDKTANYKVRMQACMALTVIGDKRSLDPLLDVAETGYIEGGFTNLREAAVMAYSRIVGAEAVKTVSKIEAMVTDEKIKAYKQTQDTFKEALSRTKVAVECKDDPVCYGKKVNDASLSLAQREKAGIMIGVLADGRKALDALIKALPNREPTLRLYFLESAKRIGKATDTELVKLIETLAEKDSKRKTKFLGADLATADKVALAVVKRSK